MAGGTMKEIITSYGWFEKFLAFYQNMKGLLQGNNADVIQ